MDLVSVHGEADSGGPHGVFLAGYGEMDEEETGWYLSMGIGRERSEVRG